MKLKVDFSNFLSFEQIHLVYDSDFMHAIFRGCLKHFIGVQGVSEFVFKS